MSERLRPRDLAFLAERRRRRRCTTRRSRSSSPASSGFDYDRLVALIADRIAFVPRYRQRCSRCPAGWPTRSGSTTTHFDLGYHVRRSALPRPGTNDQLRELVARIVSRPLDRHRPLWEVYFVEGLADGRVGAALQDPPGARRRRRDRRPRPGAARQGRPGRRSWARRVAAARQPSSPGCWQRRSRTPSPSRARSSTRCAAGRRLGAAHRRRGHPGRPGGRRADRPPSRPRVADLRPALPAAPGGPVDTDLADYRKVREAHGGTVNDVMLATVTGALRAWLMTRAESMGGLRQIHAVVPISVIDDELEATSLGSQIAAALRDLPIGEASPVVRLHQVSYSFQAHKETGRGVAANRLAGHRRLRPDDVPRDRLAGGRRRAAPRLPARDHQRPRPAVAAVRRRRADGRAPTRCRRCCPATRWRSA